VTLDDLLDDRQPDAGAFEVGSGVQTLEHAEQFTCMRRIEADVERVKERVA